MTTRNRAGTAANFYGAVAAGLADDVRELVADTGGREYQRAYDLAPKRTGYMASKLRLEFTPEQYGYDLGYHAEDFEPFGLRFYPVDQEFGTSKMAAQPSLFPARAETRPEFQRDLSALLRNAKRRHGARRAT